MGAYGNVGELAQPTSSDSAARVKASVFIRASYPAEARNAKRPSGVLVAPLVVRAQQVGAEIVAWVMPHRVDVVGVVLRVVELDQERRAVHAVVVAVGGLGQGCPREMEARWG